MTFVAGFICKLISTACMAYRFVLLKRLDSIYDEIREKDPDIDQADWDKVFEVCKDDVYFHGEFYAIHKVDLYQYLTIPVYSLFDVIAILYIPFVLFGALNVCAIVFYQFMIIKCLNDVVDWNEWLAVLFLVVTTVFMCIFAPDDPDDLRSVDDSWEDARFNTGADSFIWLACLIVVKIFTFVYLNKQIAWHINLKDEEIISDHYEPRPKSFYNLNGPAHLAVNGAIFVVIIKFLMNLSSDGNQGGAVIASVFVFVFAGVGCTALGYHSFHDMIGELHSATVFPVFILLQSALSIVSGIINFMEKPTNPLGFWISFGGLMIAIGIFVGVMEWNEPFDEDDVAIDLVLAGKEVKKEEVQTKSNVQPAAQKRSPVECEPSLYPQVYLVEHQEWAVGS